MNNSTVAKGLRIEGTERESEGDAEGVRGCVLR